MFSLLGLSPLSHGTADVLQCSYYFSESIFTKFYMCPSDSSLQEYIITHQNCLSFHLLRQLQLKLRILRSRTLRWSGLWASLWDIALISHWCSKAQPTGGGTILRKVGMGCIKKVDENEVRNIPISRILCGLCLSRFFQVAALSSSLVFPPWQNLTCKPNKPFLFQVAFGHEVSKEG